MKELILGGVRSGKSHLANSRARASGLEVTVIATALAGDDAEMQRRIAAHRAQRPSDWGTVEEPVALARALREHASADRCVVVECLTLWLSNLVCSDRTAMLEVERRALLDTLPGLPGRVIFVANETNLGVHPMGEPARRFCDEAGATHQMIAGLCERVTLTVAGLPWTLKGPRP
ncbi:MAG TPA: bifunctional adenosylcobinamide kinase/adenosylcobinamide-phosphate guanylyltransferase [Woeseiaceae bacterium]|nr:bifunctional adenosylcobinamide kinase/adenosylcobinamide-phosphate guanylyltransferase [Woeseiaceae bacterium]